MQYENHVNCNTEIKPQKGNGTHRDGVFMGEGEAAGDEVLLGLGPLVHDLEDSRLELGDDGNVVGRDAVLSSGAGDDHLGDLGLAVDGLVGEVEVERHGAVAGLGRGRHAPGHPTGNGGEGSSEGKHGWVGGFPKEEQRKWRREWKGKKSSESASPSDHWKTGLPPCYNS